MESTSLFDVRVVSRAFKRFRGLFTGLFLLTLALTMWLSHEPPLPVTQPSAFTSSTKVMVTPPKSAETSTNEPVGQWFASEQLMTQLVLSKAVLQKVSESGQLTESWQQLRGQITLQPVNGGQQWSGQPESFLIQLDVQADSPEKSRLIAELLVEKLIEYTQELSAREAIASRRLLEDMIVENKVRLENAQQKIVDWRSRNDAWDVNQLIEAHGQKIAELKEKRDAHQSEIDGLRIKQASLDTAPIEPEGSISSASGTELNEILARLEAEQSKLSALKQIYQDQNASVQAQSQIVQDVRAELQAARQKIVSSGKSALQQEIAQHQLAMGRLNREIEDLKSDGKLANSQVELEALQGQLRSLQANGESLEAELNRARVLEEKHRHLGAFTVIEEPQLGAPIMSGVPGVRKTLRERALYSFGLALAVAGCAVLVAHYHSETSMLRPKVEEALEQPVLGLIPRLPKQFARRWSEAATESREAFLVLSDSGSRAAEQFRGLVVNLMNVDAPPRRILVTSCWPGDGKSLVCANLAASLTKFRYKVRLVDGDMRRPHLTKTFQLEKAPGLRECLERGLPIEEFFQPTSVDNLTFLPAGTGEGNAAELLSEDVMLQRLTELAGEEKQILLVDSPPVSVCSDALQLGALMDGVVLVVNQANWIGKAERDYLEDLLDHEIPILGIVLNGVREQEVSYGYKDKYAGYYS